MAAAAPPPTTAAAATTESPAPASAPVTIKRSKWSLFLSFLLLCTNLVVIALLAVIIAKIADIYSAFVDHDGLASVRAYVEMPPGAASPITVFVTNMPTSGFD